MCESEFYNDNILQMTNLLMHAMNKRQDYNEATLKLSSTFCGPSNLLHCNKLHQTVHISE